MKQLYLPVVILILGLSVSKAQHFTFFPDRIHEESVSAFEYSHHTIYMENLTGGELILGWERLSMDVPSAWQTDLCDYVSCYMGIPESGTMSAVSDTTKGYLRISLNPNDTPGTGTVVFKVFDNKHPEVADTCTFILHAAATTGINLADSPNTLSIHPNPAVDEITVHSNSQTETIKIYDLQGRLMKEQRTAGQQSTKISLRNLQRGVYLVTTTGKRKVSKRKKLLLQ